ncbi:MAG: hypothetical protein IPH24_00255 [Crocinitomicaceae bacterium]|nr:hypothetical protein [Crocinitomicaceae bacterium]
MKVTKFSIFTPPSKYKRFEYTPQFYDPEKEAREKRLKQLEAEEDIKAIQKGEKPISFRHGSRHVVDYKTQMRKSNIRLVIILGIVILIVYYLFQTVVTMDAATPEIPK